MIKRRIGRALSWMWLVFLAAACQSNGWMATPGSTTPVSPTGLPTSLPVMQLTRTPTQVAQPSPTAAAESANATPVQPATVFTLTIVHTGQVYGEITPCG